MKISIIEFIFRGLPEGFLFILAAYVFSKKTIRLKPYIFSSILFSAVVYGIRFLPVHNGINNILNLIVLIILCNKINKIDTIKSIQTGFVSMILEFICEGINILIIQYIFRLDINFIFSQPKLKILYGLPSLLIFAFILLFYRKLSKKNKNRLYF